MTPLCEPHALTVDRSALLMYERSAMPVRTEFSQTPYSRQAAIAVEDSRAALHRSNATIKAKKQALRSINAALRKSSDAIASSRDALAEQARRHAAWTRRGF
jgi:hypothetical protein